LALTANVPKLTWCAGEKFTKTIHHDTYEAIDPSKADLSGKVVLITGASRGLGKNAALTYARVGISGIAVAARSSKDLDETIAEILNVAKVANRPVPKVLKIILDVTDANAVEDAAAQTEKTFGRLDILINNAGILEEGGLIAETDPEAWWKTWTLNVRGPYLVTRAFLPLLLKSSDGDKTIVNVSSFGAHMVIPSRSAYMVSEFLSAGQTNREPKPHVPRIPSLLCCASQSSLRQSTHSRGSSHMPSTPAAWQLIWGSVSPKLIMSS
jgi:NADP-dependent 3-hydroxy acid dehydrogenase YdfG